jgi:hypothetical protein
MAHRATWPARQIRTYRPAPLAATALRLLTAPCGRRSHRGALRSRLASLATDHSGHAGALRTASPFRAKMDVPSAPALHPFGSCGPRRSRPRRTSLRRGERGMRWPLAPGGSPRGAGGCPPFGALSLASQGALAKARGRARRWFCRALSSENRDVVASRCRARERLRN